MFASGPVGPCSPGIHFGYTKVNGPDLTGIVICAYISPRHVSRASSTSVIGSLFVAYAVAVGVSGVKASLSAVCATVMAPPPMSAAATSAGMMANLMAFCLARYCERLLAAVGTCDARGYKAAMDKLQRDRRGEIFQDELTENESMPRPPQRDDAEGEKKYDTD